MVSLWQKISLQLSYWIELPKMYLLGTEKLATEKSSERFFVCLVKLSKLRNKYFACLLSAWLESKCHNEFGVRTLYWRLWIACDHLFAVLTVSDCARSLAHRSLWIGIGGFLFRKCATISLEPELGKLSDISLINCNKLSSDKSEYLSLTLAMSFLVIKLCTVS